MPGEYRRIMIARSFPTIPLFWCWPPWKLLS
jgi:hypothetical protein